METRTVWGLGIREPPTLSTIVRDNCLAKNRGNKTGITKNKTETKMIVRIIAQWGATPLFDAGERQFEIDWGNHTVPATGNVIRLCSFIESLLTPSETFTYNGEQTNVFKYIEDEEQWIVQQVAWEQKEHGLTGYLLVTDTEQSLK